jgi:tetratricopeptide (TPR) repeat protein
MNKLPLLILVLAFACGCIPESQQALQRGAQALKAKNYDDASEYASEVLGREAGGPLRAEALYLRGRAFEERIAEAPGELALNLQTARLAYIEALRHSPSRALLPYIHTSLGKVCFFQEDYPTAARELRTAYDLVRENELRAPILFYMARAQQRLARFGDADANFDLLIENFGRSEWARKAREVRGARAFYVQLGAWSSAANADTAAASLRRRGVTPIRLIDAQSRHLLRAGPCSTYDQANQLRKQLADQYPGGIIVP